MQFNKVNNPIYTVVANYTIVDDGSISAKYVVGTGRDEEGQIVDFIPICETHKYIAPKQAVELINAPMTKDDLGKTPNAVMLGRIYDYLKTHNEIVI